MMCSAALQSCSLTFAELYAPACATLAASPGAMTAKYAATKISTTITAAVAQRGHITLDERMTIRLASTFAIHTGLEVVDVLYQAAGATAIFNENPFERRFRDVHSVAQQLQGRQQHFETVGQHLMGLEADTGWL